MQCAEGGHFILVSVLKATVDEMLGKFETVGSKIWQPKVSLQMQCAEGGHFILLSVVKATVDEIIGKLGTVGSKI